MLINRIRYYHYISGVLANQQTDPLCRQCKAYANTVIALRDGLVGLEKENSMEFGSFPGEMRGIFEEARRRITAMPAPENATGQKKPVIARCLRAYALSNLQRRCGTGYRKEPVEEYLIDKTEGIRLSYARQGDAQKAKIEAYQKISATAPFAPQVFGSAPTLLSVFRHPHI